MATENDKGAPGPNVRLLEGAVPTGFKLGYDESLFNSEVHRNIQSPGGWHSFHLLKMDKKKVMASVHFCVAKGVASSPALAPFGSFEMSPALSTAQLFDFIAFVEGQLLRHGAKKIVVKCPPQHYNTGPHNILSVLLFNHQYKARNAEIGAVIQVAKAPFTDRLDPWEKRKLKQGAKAGLKCTAVPLGHLHEIYHFILACRKERGQHLSMAFEALLGTVEKLKSRFVLFGVYHKGVLVAASIAIRVNKKVLYNFYSAHSQSSNPLSPVVFLIGEMYDWCGKHHIELLDLGTSALHGKPNFTLVDFKLRLGATPSMKLEFEKKLK